MDEHLIEKRISSDCLYSGRVIKLFVDDVVLPNGAQSKREYVSHRGGAAALAVDEEGYTYLVKQFRYPYGKVMLEIPAGKLEEGEDALVTAVRELEEETGLKCGKTESYGRICPSPGYTDEYIYVYEATKLTQSRAHLDPGEFVDVVKMPVKEAIDLALRGEINDSKTCYALFRYALTHNLKV